MKIEGVGYEYKGFRLGEKVLYNGEERIVIGFDESASFNCSFIAIVGNGILVNKSVYITSALYGYTNAFLDWISPHQITKTQEEKQRLTLNTLGKQIHREGKILADNNIEFFGKYQRQLTIEWNNCLVEVKMENGEYKQINMVAK